MISVSRLANVKSVVIATANAGKAREFAHRFRQLGIAIRSLADYPSIPPIIEDGTTFMANAEIKARTVAAELNEPAIADDSGLRVEALSGDPGVYSARYAGEDATDEQNIEKLLAELRLNRAAFDFHPPDLPLPEGIQLLSPAEFVCALVFYDPKTETLHHVEGNCPGYIIDRPRGSGGFGYDPVFYLPQFGKTMAELTLEEKQAVSHRGKAMDLLIELFLSQTGSL